MIKRTLRLLPLTALLIGGCQKPTSAVADRREIVGYEALAAELVVPPTEIANVLPTYRAPVQRVLVTVGARVNRGEVLVELSFPNAQAAHEQARLNVKSAETSLAQAQREYSTSVQMYQTKVRNLRAARDGGFQFDPAELLNAERNLADALAQRNSSVEPYKEALKQAQEYLAETRVGAKLASIRAPISGTVIALNAESGKEVGVDSKEPIATIVDLEALEVHAVLDGKVKVDEGDEFVVSFSELPDQSLPGRVSKITTMAGTNERRAIVQFENTKGLVKPGMKATASVKTGEVKDVIAVPTAAVDKDSTGKPIVNVLKGSDWVVTVVEVGLSGGGYTEIKSGVSEGDTVQVAP